MGGTFKPVPQPRLEVPARTGRHRFSQQRRLLCDSNWGANLVKPRKGTPLPVEPTLYWYIYKSSWTYLILKTDLNDYIVKLNYYELKVILILYINNKYEIIFITRANPRWNYKFTSPFEKQKEKEKKKSKRVKNLKQKK